ncbi:MAG: hypothetical protein ACOYI8_03165 [Christensenellales bacterium]|jgi:hypothetical protein
MVSILILASYSVKESCYRFISEHYEKGEKGQALSFPFKDKYKKNGKHQHTVSLYLMGLILKRTFTCMIKSKLGEFIDDLSEWYSYEYTWYLTCLYHDAASCIEQNDCETPQSLCGFLNKMDIRYYPGMPCFLGHRVKAPLRFSRDVISAYYNYRREINKSQEHGIIAGYLLYDKLLYDFNSYTEKGTLLCNGVYTDRKKHLDCRFSHIDHFEYIADAIICHNIWLCTKETDIKNYKKYGLNKLIVKSNGDKLSIDKYPLQFLLCLLDTIEPIKRFDKLPPEEVLKNISLEDISRQEDKKREYTLRLKWTSKIEKQGVFSRWRDSILDMESWLNVKVSPCRCDGDECFVDIQISTRRRSPHSTMPRK